MTEQQPRPDVIGFDHVNLKTRDMHRAINFYSHILGLKLVRADRNDDGSIRFAAFRTGDGLIDIQPAPEGDWTAERTGLNHFALLIEPTDLDALAASFRERGIEIVEGPVPRQGAYGDGVALYIRDPDGHGIELKHYQKPEPLK